MQTKQLPYDLKHFHLPVSPVAKIRKTIKDTIFYVSSIIADVLAFLIVLFILAAVILSIILAAASIPVPEPLQVPVEKAVMTKEVRL